MNFRQVISRLPGIGAMVARSLGWQQAMFGDLMNGGSSTTGDLTRAYAKSAWVRSAIGFVAAPIAMRPLIFSRDKRGGDMVIDDAALTKFWERPARDCTGIINRQDFMEATVGLLKLKGQCFWIMDDTWLTPRAKKTPLILAKPDSMHAMIEDGELIGWSYSDKWGGKSGLITEQVIHLKFWNPYHDWMGLSEWEGAMIAAESDYAGGVFARNLAKNNGDRGPYVIGKGGQFSDDQIKQVSAQLRQKRELGRRGEFRAAFLPADVDVKEPGVNAVDSAFVTQRLENRKEIYAAFGVPQSFADAQASYSIGSASDRFRLIEDTCMPLAAKIADGMEVVSQRFLGTRETVFVEFDWDSHSTMQQVRAERFETAAKAVNMGMPWKTAGEYFRLRLPRFPGDSVGRIPFNLTEIENPEARDQIPEVGEVEEVDPVADLEKVFAAYSQHSCKGHAGEVQPKAVSAKALATWKRVRARREAWEKKYASRIRRHLMDARGETLRKIAAAGEVKAVGKSVDVLSLIFDLDAWLKDWIKGLGATARAAIEAAGAELWSEELGRDDALTMPAAETLEILRVRENRIKDAGTKVWEAIKSELETGIESGETMDQLAERVRRKFGGMDKGRAMVIAKTETTAVYEGGRDIVFKAAGVQWTQWLTSGLGNERMTHLAANEQIQAIEDKFLVGGYELAYPGDPEGPPQEVINCNCVRIAVSSPEGGDDGEDFNNDDTIPY